MLSLKIIVVTIFPLLTLSHESKAAISVLEEFAGNHNAYNTLASSSDLVNNGASTLDNFSTSPPWFGAGGINNGSAVSNTANSTFYWDNRNFPAVIQFDLDTSVNTLGYNITSIQSIAGWASNSTSHANQIFTVEYSQVGSAGYSTLHSVNFTPYTGGNGNKSSRVLLTDTSGVLATAVDSIRITYTSGGTWGSAPGVVVKEIDIEGYATPEPSALLLTLLTVTGFLLKRQR